MTIDIDKLRQLEQAATPAPWFAFFNNRLENGRYFVEIRRGNANGRYGSPGPQMKTFQYSPCDECGSSHVNGVDRWAILESRQPRPRGFGCGRKGYQDCIAEITADAELVSHARNALPALLDEIEALRTRLEAMTKARDEACDIAMRWLDPMVDAYDRVKMLSEVGK